jgi:hypothetical protein
MKNKGIAMATVSAATTKTLNPGERSAGADVSEAIEPLRWRGRKARRGSWRNRGAPVAA